jgi:hypothetical protein
MPPVLLPWVLASVAAFSAGSGLRGDSGWSFDPADLKAPGGRFPQLVDADALYRAARARREAVNGPALLLCRVSVDEPRRWDFLRGPDVKVELRVGTARARVAWGVEDAATTTVSFPATTLRPGERVEVAVHDRDATTDEHIGTAATRVPKGSGALELQTPTFDMRCASLPESAWSDRFEAAARRARRALKALDDARPDLTKEGAGWPLHDVTAAEMGVQEMAAFAGWGEAEVRLAYEAMRDSLASWRTRLAAAVSAAEAAATPVGEAVAVDGGRVALAEVRCGKQALLPWRDVGRGGEGRGAADLRYLADTARCVYLFDVEAGAAGLSLRAGHGGLREVATGLRAYRAAGDAVSLVPFDFLRAGASVPGATIELTRGQRVTVVAAPASLLRPGPRGARVIALTGSRGVLFRVPR